MVFVAKWQGDRIKEARRRFPGRMTQGDLSTRIGRTRELISRYESGLSPIPDAVLAKIAEELHIPLAFLEDESYNPKAFKSDVVYHSDPQELTYSEIPYWGEVPAGDWQIPGEEGITMQVEKGLAGPNRRAVRVAGDSMNPRLNHGDVVHIELSKTPREGCITLARNHNGELTLKTLKHKDGQWELHSFNPDYPNPIAPVWEILGYAVVIERHYGPGRYLREVDELGIRATP